VLGVLHACNEICLGKALKLLMIDIMYDVKDINESLSALSSWTLVSKKRSLVNGVTFMWVNPDV